MKYFVFLLLSLPIVFISCSEITIDDSNPLTDGDRTIFKKISAQDSSGFEYRVTYENIDTFVYSTVSRIYIGNDNDPNYGNLSLYSAIRMIPYDNDYNSNYEYENVKEILSAHLTLYGYSNSYDSDSTNTLNIAVYPLLSRTSFSTLNLKNDIQYDPVSVGDTSFTNNIHGKLNIPLTNTEYLRRMLEFNSSSSDSADYNSNIFGFLIKAPNTAVSKTQGFYGYGTTYSPELTIDIVVEKDGIQDTVTADFTIEAANQLSKFEEIGNWSVQTNPETIKIINFSGLRPRIDFTDIEKYIPQVATIVSSKLTFSVDTLVSKHTLNSTLISSESTAQFYPNYAENYSVVSLSAGFQYVFNISNSIQKWSLNPSSFKGFFILSSTESSSVEKNTLFLNKSDKKATFQTNYIERVH